MADTDKLAGDLAGNTKHWRVVVGTQCCGGIQYARTGHHTIGGGPAGGLGIAIGQVGGPLFVATDVQLYLVAILVQGWEPRLDLVIDGSPPIDPVMRALKMMSDSDVPTRIQVTTEFLGGVQQRFEQDRSDTMPVKEYHPGPTLTAHPLPPTTFILVASREHPWPGSAGSNWSSSTTMWS